jgi:hypothetical protein
MRFGLFESLCKKRLQRGQDPGPFCFGFLCLGWRNPRDRICVLAILGPVGRDDFFLQWRGLNNAHECITSGNWFF